MQSQGLLITLRLMHVVIGAYWVGAAVFIAFFLLPSVRAVGPAAGPIMDQLARVRKLPLYMMGAAITTVLSGTGLLYRNIQISTGAWMGTGPGQAYSLGATFAFVAVILGMAVSSPAGRKLGELAGAIVARGGPPKPEETAQIQALQKRFGMSTTIVAVLVLLAVTCMSVARYL